jgi:glutamate synthase (NADPH/NADH)
MRSIKNMSHRGWKTAWLDSSFGHEEGTGGLAAALDRLCEEASKAVADGFSILVLSDERVDEGRVPVPSLVAIGAVHQHLVTEGTRLKVALFNDSGEVREVHHLCSSIGFGADGVCPRMSFELIAKLEGSPRLRPNANGSAGDAPTPNLALCDAHPPPPIQTHPPLP